MNGVKKRILLVEDEPHLAFNIEFNLQAEGYEVVPATNGQVALDKFRVDGPFDLVVLDVMMTSPTEGFHVAYKLREDAALKLTPILMLTSVSAESGFTFDPQKDGEYLPVDTFIDKPITPDKLIAAVKKLLELKPGQINTQGIEK